MSIAVNSIKSRLKAIQLPYPDNIQSITAGIISQELNNLLNRVTININYTGQLPTSPPKPEISPDVWKLTPTINLSWKDSFQNFIKSIETNIKSVQLICPVVKTTLLPYTGFVLNTQQGSLGDNPWDVIINDIKLALNSTIVRTYPSTMIGVGTSVVSNINIID